MDAYNADVEAILRRQEEAMALLEKLRHKEQISLSYGETEPGSEGGRAMRRWPMPDTVVLEIYDGKQWNSLGCTDIGIGGARLQGWTDTIETPVPARMKRDGVTVAMALVDLMWQEKQQGTAGIRFEFFDNDNRDNWADHLVDALLGKYSIR